MASKELRNEKALGSSIWWLKKVEGNDMGAIGLMRSVTKSVIGSTEAFLLGSAFSPVATVPIALPWNYCTATQ